MLIEDAVVGMRVWREAVHALRPWLTHVITGTIMKVTPRYIWVLQDGNKGTYGSCWVAREWHQCTRAREP